MNIAFLHGNHQNSDVFCKLMKQYIKVIKQVNQRNGVETNFYHINAKYSFIPYSDSIFEDNDGDYRMWYKTPLDINQISEDGSYQNIPEDDIFECLDYVSTFIEENNINFLIGFSQGGNVVDTYLRLRNNDGKIKTAIIINGYSFKCYSDIVPFIDRIIYISSDKDLIIKPNSLKNNYNNLIEFKHEMGHKINTSMNFIRQLFMVVLEN